MKCQQKRTHKDTRNKQEHLFSLKYSKMFTASKDVQERNILRSRTNADAISNDPIYSNTQIDIRG